MILGAVTVAPGAPHRCREREPWLPCPVPGCRAGIPPNAPGLVQRNLAMTAGAMAYERVRKVAEDGSLIFAWEVLL